MGMSAPSLHRQSTDCLILVGVYSAMKMQCIDAMKHEDFFDFFIQIGATALLYASGMGHLKVIQLLLQANADVNIASEVGAHIHAVVCLLIPCLCNQVGKFPLHQQLLPLLQL